MAKTLKEAPLTTRSARAGLAQGLHWRGIDHEVHLGYRKGKRGGVWLVRWRTKAGYRQEKLGAADDHIAEGTLAYGDAVKVAREKVVTVRRHAVAEAAGPVVTVRAAVEAYIAERNAEDSRRAGRPLRSDAATRLERYVIGRPARGKRAEVSEAPIAQVPLYDLTVRDLTNWRTNCAGLGETALRRLSNDFRAALNAAADRQGDVLPAGLPGVIKRGLKSKKLGDTDTTARESQILTDSEVSALIRAAKVIDSEQGWEGDLFRLVVVMASTGARFAQVARLRVGDLGRDVQSGVPIISMPNSRKGRGGKADSTPIPVGKDVLEALLPVITGRANNAPLLERWRHVREPGIVPIIWKREGRGAWRTSSELVRPWRAIRERAGQPAAIPYGLRHSSIVRGLRAGLPVSLVAKNHDTSAVIIEAHYGKYIASGLLEMAARAVVPLVQSE